MRRLLTCFFSATAALAVAPPMTPKDVALMARGGYSEAEILAEVQKRRLAVPIDAAAERAMLEGGAPAELIAKIKGGTFVLSAEQQAALARREAEQRVAAMQREQNEESLRQRQRETAAAITKAQLSRDNIRQLLDGKLVRLQASQVVPFSATELRDVRLFAFYYSANWCPSCRKTTPALADWYRRVKAAHPEFELIFVSQDRSEITFNENLRKNAMPWPGVRYSDVRDAGVNRFAGSSIPWLVGVTRAGDPVTKNAADKQYIEPATIMQAIEAVLADLGKPGVKLRGE